MLRLITYFITVWLSWIGSPTALPMDEAEPRSIAIITSSSALQLSQDQRETLAKKVTRIVSSTSGYSAIPFVPCDQEVWPSGTNQVEGATGRKVQVAEAWQDEKGQLFRGFLSDSWRPGTDERQALRESNRNVLQRLEALRSVPHLAAEDVPNDVFLYRETGRSWLGCDWNLDLQLQPEEVYEIQSGKPELLKHATGALLLQVAQQTARDDQPPEIQFWPITSPEDQTKVVFESVVTAEIDPSHEVTLIQMNRAEDLNPKSSLGAFEFEVALEHAISSGCDLVIANEADFGGDQVSVRAMLSQVQSQKKLPVCWWNESETPSDKNTDHDFSTRLNQLIQQPSSAGFREQEPTRGHGAIIAGLWPGLSIEDAGTFGESTWGAPIARLPASLVAIRTDLQKDPITGLPSVPFRLLSYEGLQLEPWLRHDGGTLMLPQTMLDASAGYAIGVKDRKASAQREPEESLESVQGSPQITRKIGPPSEPFSINVLQGNSTKDLYCRSIARARQLLPVESQQVPIIVRNAAGSLLDRSSNVRTAWYRVDSVTGDPVPARILSGPLEGPTAGNQLLVHWFSNFGERMGEGLQLGDPTTTANQIRWLLLEEYGEMLPEFDNSAETLPLYLVQQAEPAALEQASGNLWKRVAGPFPSSTATNETTSRFEGQLASEMAPGPGQTLIGGWFTKGETILPARWLFWEGPQRSETPSRGVPQPAWWSHYREDPADRWLSQMGLDGRTPREILEQLLEAYGSSPEDLVTLRLLLHATDQIKIRKENLSETVRLAEMVLSGCQSIDSTEWEATDRLALEAWKIDAAYRKFRAIGYRELPEVMAKHPISDQAKQDSEFDKAYTQLSTLAPMEHPEFVLARVRWERKHGRSFEALAALDQYACFDENARWFYKKLKDISQDLECELLYRWASSRWFLIENGLSNP